MDSDIEMGRENLRKAVSATATLSESTEDTPVHLSKEYLAKNQTIRQFTDNIEQLRRQRQAFCHGAFETLENRKLGQTHRLAGLRRELFRITERLPALSSRLEFEAALRSNEFIVVVGENGSGKSTQLPQYVIDMPEYSRDAKVLCTQPRRIAAVTLAQRVAVEFAGGNERVGKMGFHVGFQIGGLSCIHEKHTKIEYLTEGILVQQIADRLSNQFDERRRILLEECAVVIVDEVHERNMNTDLLLGLLKLTKNRFPNLKIVVSSATVDSSKFSKYFNDCPVVSIPGRSFPVEIIYEPMEFGDKNEHLARKVAHRAADVVSTADSGDVLCFLTGQAEVEKARDACLAKLSVSAEGKDSQVVVEALFGKQTPDEQQEAVKKLPDGSKRVIFATDVAETSLTIEGIRYVIDCGYTKDFLCTGNMSECSFKVFRVSKSSAHQRAGRAGRCLPGTCYRLYSQSDYEAMNEYRSPDVLKKPLGLALTTLMSIGQNPFDFDWPDKPDQRVIAAVMDDLKTVGAIDEQTLAVTELGKAIAKMQIEPNIGRLLFHTCKIGFGEVGVILAGLMRISGQIFLPSPARPSRFLSPQAGDFVSAYHAFTAWQAIKEADEQSTDLSEELERQLKLMGDEESNNGSDDEFAETAYVSDDDDWATATAGITTKITAGPLKGESELPEPILLDAVPVSDVVKAWSLKNGINCSMMMLIFCEVNAIRRRLQSTGLWSLNDNQSKEPTSDQVLQRLVLQGCFFNIAFFEQIPTPNGLVFKHLLPMMNGEVAEINKKSVVRRLVGNSPAASCVAYYEVFRPTGMGLFLDRVTPVQHTWLAEDFRDYYTTKLWPKYSSQKAQLVQAIQLFQLQNFMLMQFQQNRPQVGSSMVFPPQFPAPPRPPFR